MRANSSSVLAERGKGVVLELAGERRGSLQVALDRGASEVALVFEGLQTGQHLDHAVASAVDVLAGLFDFGAGSQVALLEEELAHLGQLTVHGVSHGVSAGDLRRLTLEVLGQELGLRVVTAVSAAGISSRSFLSLAMATTTSLSTKSRAAITVSTRADALPASTSAVCLAL